MGSKLWEYCGIFKDTEPPNRSAMASLPVYLPLMVDPHLSSCVYGQSKLVAVHPHPDVLVFCEPPSSISNLGGWGFPVPTERNGLLYLWLTSSQG